MQSPLQIETKPGKPISSGKYRIIPFSQSVQINFPQVNGGLTWNRPVSVLAIDSDGEETVIPVPDITRRIQIAIVGLGFMTVLIVWLISRFQQTLRR